MASDAGNIPQEAATGAGLVLEALGETVIGIYLFGSAVSGGLRPNSDVDLLVVVKHALSTRQREGLLARLLAASAAPARPLEVTVVNTADLRPWHFPPRAEFVFGEWLREAYENGAHPEPVIDPDLAIILRQVADNSLTLFGAHPSDVFEPIPAEDIRRAIRNSLPPLLDHLVGDERNVLLTLARMWFTAVTGNIVSKEAAAEWAILQLPEDLAPLLDAARLAHRGEQAESWSGRHALTAQLAEHMREQICLNLDLGSLDRPGD